MADLRKCIMCGTVYEYCIHCGDAKKDEPWKYVYHDENCMAINYILRSYRGNEISKSEARIQMDQYPQNIAMIMKNDSIAAKEIKDIYSVNGDNTTPSDLKANNDLVEKNMSKHDDTLSTEEIEVDNDVVNENSEKKKVRTQRGKK